MVQVSVFDDQLDSFCRVYVNSDRPFRDFVSSVAALLKCEGRQNSIRSLLLDVSVDENDDFEEAKAQVGADRFLYFPYMLAIDPAPEVAMSAYISAIGQLLAGLWASGTDAVAACEFEDQLPVDPRHAEWNVQPTPNSPLESLAHLPIGSQHQANTNG